MNMDKAVFKNLITSIQPNPVENTMFGDLLHTFFALKYKDLNSSNSIEETVRVFNDSMLTERFLFRFFKKLETERIV